MDVNLNMDKDEISTKPLEELWEYFKRNKRDFSNGNYEKVYKAVRYGISNINYDIEFLIKEIYNINKKRETIMINKKTWNLSDVFTERDDRIRILSEFLLDNTESGSIIE